MTVKGYGGIGLTGGGDALDGIDRFDSKRPYEWGNVVFCCWFVNRMKYDYTDLEFIGACEHIAKNKEGFTKMRIVTGKHHVSPLIRPFRIESINTYISFFSLT